MKTKSKADGVVEYGNRMKTTYTEIRGGGPGGFDVSLKQREVGGSWRVSVTVRGAGTFTRDDVATEDEAKSTADQAAQFLFALLGREPTQWTKAREAAKSAKR